jgi:hypothetical protein
MSTIITSKFEAPSEHRDDISFELKESCIYGKPVGALYNEQVNITTPDKSITVWQYFKTVPNTSYYISIPLNQIDNFCRELKEYANKVKLLGDSIK